MGYVTLRMAESAPSNAKICTIEKDKELFNQSKKIHNFFNVKNIQHVNDLSEDVFTTKEIFKNKV